MTQSIPVPEGFYAATRDGAKWVALLDAFTLEITAARVTFVAHRTLAPPCGWGITISEYTSGRGVCMLRGVTAATYSRPQAVRMLRAEIDNGASAPPARFFAAIGAAPQLNRPLPTCPR